MYVSKLCVDQSGANFLHFAAVSPGCEIRSSPLQRVKFWLVAVQMRQTFHSHASITRCLMSTGPSIQEVERRNTCFVRIFVEACARRSRLNKQPSANACRLRSQKSTWIFTLFLYVSAEFLENFYTEIVSLQLCKWGRVLIRLICTTHFRAFATRWGISQQDLR